MLVKLFILILSIPIVFLIGLPIILDVALLVLIILFLLRFEITNLVLVIFGLIIGLSLSELFARQIIKTTDKNSAYRPHDVYASSLSYRANLNVNFTTKHGDLCAIDPTICTAVSKNFEEVFITNSKGMRHHSEFKSADIPLVGDSFVVGNANSQENTLSSILKTEYHIDSYPLAFPTVPDHLLIMVEQFYQQTFSNNKFIFFIFEGNDFKIDNINSRNIIYSKYDQFKQKVIKDYTNNIKLNKLIFNSFLRFKSLNLYNKKPPVEIRTIGNTQMAFYGAYIDIAKDPTPQLNLYNEALLNRLKERLLAVVFIPTKYRVYSKILNEKLIEPPPALKATQQKFESIPVYDLTPLLQKSAADLLSENKLVFHADDTHWNVYGIKVAAKKVSEILKTSSQISIEPLIRNS